MAAGAFAALLWIDTAARAGYSLDQLVPVLVALAIMLATRALADINRTSLHDFYRWRLADAFAVTRDAVEAPPGTREELLATAAATRLSELSGDQDGPALVIATTANINADRSVPPGRGGFCLTFDPDTVRLRGDPRAGEPEAEASTADYEHLLGHTRFTLFDVVAISGAAFSPLMGAATRGAYRILFTLTNMRLGIWMPHPEVVRRARQYLRTASRAARTAGGGSGCCCFGTCRRTRSGTGTPRSRRCARPGSGRTSSGCGNIARRSAGACAAPWPGCRRRCAGA